jgi:hypothetical protein
MRLLASSYRLLSLSVGDSDIQHSHSNLSALYSFGKNLRAAVNDLGTSALNRRI